MSKRVKAENGWKIEFSSQARLQLEQIAREDPEALEEILSSFDPTKGSPILCPICHSQVYFKDDHVVCYNKHKTAFEDLP